MNASAIARAPRRSLLKIELSYGVIAITYRDMAHAHDAHYCTLAPLWERAAPQLDTDALGRGVCFSELCC
jgi:hypothetical protein